MNYSVPPIVIEVHIPLRMYRDSRGTVSDVTLSISVFGQNYNLISAVYFNGCHFRTFHRIDGVIYWYDGMKKTNDGHLQVYKGNSFPVQFGDYFLNHCFYLTESNDDLFDKLKNSLNANIVGYKTNAIESYETICIDHTPPPSPQEAQQQPQALELEEATEEEAKTIVLTNVSLE